MNAAATPITLPADQWEAKYKPIVAPGNRDDDSWACLYHSWTNPQQWRAVIAAHERDPGKVWTLLSIDDDDADDSGENINPGIVLASGLHYTNRLAYIVTEVPLEKGIPFCDVIVN